MPCTLVKYRENLLKQAMDLKCELIVETKYKYYCGNIVDMDNETITMTILGDDQTLVHELAYGITTANLIRLSKNEIIDLTITEDVV